MKDKEESFYVTFADLAFQIVLVLAMGYTFMTVAVYAGSGVQRVIEIELPRMEVEIRKTGSSEATSFTIIITRSGSYMDSEGNELKREQLKNFFQRQNGQRLRMVVDRKAPTETTLYLLHLAQKNNISVDTECEEAGG